MNGNKHKYICPKTGKKFYSPWDYAAHCGPPAQVPPNKSNVPEAWKTRARGIKRMLEVGEPVKLIAEEFNVSLETVYRIRSGQTHKEIMI